MTETAKNHAKDVAEFLQDDEEIGDLAGETNNTRVRSTNEKQETEKFVDEPLEDDEPAKDGVVRKQAGQGKPLRLPLGSKSERKQKQQPPKRKRPPATTTSNLLSHEEEDSPLMTRFFVILGFILVLICGIVLVTRDPKNNNNDSEPTIQASDYENQPGSEPSSDLFD
mmetsp:Transcript_20891/g.45321  ORF Transcript_20891/g.45321 Transcript_20891/m.45321 type:complete len:168 (+) Transcript_20891:94-597(+)|eukprot:CAMPEP_0168742376 /NCGR_PEP_ID=MMETSP0724-20121128/13004_1 /TAXON_ID=265536 /ORGANISM="Amphiprora sp., Strain CCMP467" /LENGTH=167 /DNA_ID=CAMNT_0008789923 /DNA_START=112 /DNA_END=615 /DNA_ORIENTATION=+